MAHVKVAFFEILQTSQLLGVPDEHMVARLRLQIQVGDYFVCETVASVKQVTGSRYGDYDIEVGRPIHYGGPLLYDVYAAGARDYYTSAIGPEGKIIQINSGAQDIRMEGNVIQWGPVVVEFEAEATSGGAW